jgi:hypothetical protein
MMAHEIYERSPVRKLAAHLGGGLAAGSVGAIVGRAGVGKSALLVHVALDAMLREQSVVHVSLRDDVDHVRSYYDEIFGAMSRGPGATPAGGVAERRRMILSYRDRAFDVGHLGAHLDMLAEVAHFTPNLLVVDAVEGDDCGQKVAALIALAAQRGVMVWVSLREQDAGAASGCSLRPDGANVHISVVGAAGEQELPLKLDPATMLVQAEGARAGGAADTSVKAADCTLYSGGANGAEAVFGEQAQKAGAREINFTFDGHRQARTRGRYELSPRELQAGDVSLVFVSKRLHRTYSEGSLIRRVLQTIWHMVSRSQQVFVVGVIQEDGTVRGGTGWSVELARMWNKDLWVFDQERDSWHRWDGEGWVAGEPVIESVHFCGTGTRYLEDNGRKAIVDLFARSFNA